MVRLEADRGPAHDPTSGASALVVLLVVRLGVPPGSRLLQVHHGGAQVLAAKVEQGHTSRDKAHQLERAVLAESTRVQTDRAGELLAAARRALEEEAQAERAEAEEAAAKQQRQDFQAMCLQSEEKKKAEKELKEAAGKLKRLRKENNRAARRGPHKFHRIYLQRLR